MLSFSHAFSRPYMANMQSTHRNGDAEGMTHAALTKSVTTHGDGGEHGEHGGGHDEGHNDFSNAAKASLALSSQRQKESNKQTEEKDGKKDDALARVGKDPLLNRLMSQVFFNDRQESTIEFLQGSTINTMGHFSEGFTLGAVLAGLFHAQKIMNSEKENGQLIPGQIIAGRGKDGHFYKIAYTKNDKRSFWDKSKKNPNNESLQILRSKHKGFLGYFRGYEPVAEVLNPANTRYESETLELLLNNGEEPARYIASSLRGDLKIVQRIKNAPDDVIDYRRTFQVATDTVADKNVFQEVPNKAAGIQAAQSRWEEIKQFLSPVGQIFNSLDASPVQSVKTAPVANASTINTNAPLVTKHSRLNTMQTNVFDSIEGILHYLPEKFRFDPHEVMSMKKKDTLSKFLKYLPPVKNLINWGIWGGVAAVAFGTITEGYHAGMRLPNINLGGGQAPAPAEGHAEAPTKEAPTPPHESLKPENFLRQTPQIV
jgi:hypothetical protein